MKEMKCAQTIIGAASSKSLSKFFAPSEFGGRRNQDISLNTF